jgi:hypothetical protein
MAAIKKMDFKESKEKICGRPIYCKAKMNLTPTKEKAEAKENEKNEGEKELTNEEIVDKPTENKIFKPRPDTRTPTRVKIFYREWTSGVSGLGDTSSQAERLKRQINHCKSLHTGGRDKLIMGDANHKTRKIQLEMEFQHHAYTIAIPMFQRR